MLKSILSWDKNLFNLINGHWTNELLDAVMPFLRQPYFWAPFYVFIISSAIVRFPKQALRWILTGLAAVSASDLISSKIIKPGFGRIRPCLDPDLPEPARLLAHHCGANGSFTSSHAANHTTLAVFMIITLYPVLRKKGYFLLGWALLIGYAQIYVGVHFPTDILGGCLLGWILGTLFSRLYKFWGQPFHMTTLP